MVFQMLSWWYTSGWKRAFSSVLDRSASVYEYFSVPILLKTLFEPWKQIKSFSSPSSSFDVKMQVFFDNAFARTFGFILRINLVLLATLIAIFTMLFSFILAIFWPVIPVLPVVFVVLGAI